MNRNRLNDSARKSALALAALAAIFTGCKNPLVDVAQNLRAEAGSPNVVFSRGAATVKSSDTLDFGKVSTNGYKDITLTVSNVKGNSALSVDLGKVAISLGEGTEASTFSVATVSLDPIEADGSATVVLRFSPSSTGTKSASISIPTNDVKLPLFDLALTGASVANEKELSSFEISSPVAATGVISGTDVAVDVPYGTDLSKLVATFTTTGLSVSVGSNPQVSGTTVQNFAGPVVYTVTAADNTTKNYQVIVTAAKNGAKAITAFAFPACGVTATIAGLGISATLPYGTPLAGLAPTFTTTGASVAVGGTTQISGISANDFTRALTYRVTAEDGSTSDYTVAVANALNPAKEITGFSIAIPSADPASSAAGIINGSSISVTLPYGTSLASLVASFTTTGASVRVGGAAQRSGATANDFSKPVTYTVTAEDGTTRDYTVQAAAALSTSKDITSFTVTNPAGATTLISGSTISVHIPYPNSPTNLSATFTSSGASVSTLGATISGTSTLVYGSPQDFTVTAYNGSAKTYTVVVTVDDVAPSLTTGTVGSIGTASAAVGGGIVHSGGASLPILDSGICWGTSTSPTLADAHLSNGAAGSGASSISALTITGLVPGTKYFARTYAANDVDTGYGAPSSFWTLLETPPAPKVDAVGGSAGSGKLNISWTAMAGASAYDLYYSGTSTPPSSPSLTATSTFCQLSGLADFSTYHVWLVSRSASPSPSPMSPAGSGAPGVHVTRLVLPFTRTLLEGTTDQLSAEITPREATYQSLTWTSSDEAVATVSSNGLVTAGSGGGTATITARAQSPDDAVEASCAVIVPAVRVGSQSGSLSSGFAGSASFPVTAIQVAAGTTGSVAWYGNAAGTATASTPQGVSVAVSAVAEGSALITMTADATAVAGTYYFTVSEGLAVSGMASLGILQPSLSLSSQSGTLCLETATYQVAATNIPAGTTGTIAWYADVAGTTPAAAPDGVTVSVTAVAGGAATLAMEGGNQSPEGTYYFRLGMGPLASAPASLSIAFGSHYSTVLSPPAFTGGYPLQMIAVPGGTFSRDGGATNRSTVSSFHMSKHAVTGEQYAYLWGVSDPSKFKNVVNNPVECISFYKAIAFCNKLSLAEGKTPAYTVPGVNFGTLAHGSIPTSQNATWDAATVDRNVDGYRLPTEMEYVWAMMGGMSDTRSGDIVGGVNMNGYSKRYAGSQEAGSAQASIGSYAWYNVNAGGTTHSVGTRTANELGLYDLSGNVMAWCWGWSMNSSTGASLWPGGPLVDWQGAASGSYRTLKAGYWYEADAYCRPTYLWIDPWGGGDGCGIRLVSR